MARYTYDFRYDAQVVIDYGHYRAKAQKARNEMRSRLFRRVFAFLSGKRVQLPGKTRTSSVACVSY